MSQELNEEGVVRMEELFMKTGLPEELLPAIRKEMDERRELIFVFPHKTKINGKYAYVELAFYWKQKEDAHRLMSMGVSLQIDPANRLNTNIFPLLPHSEVTLQEAVNLMQGRSVYRPVGKAGEGSYWLTLDPEKQYQGVGTPELRRSSLELERSLDQLSSVFPTTEEQKKNMERNMKAGGVYFHNSVVHGKAHTISVRANPEAGRIEVRNNKGVLIDLDQLKLEKSQGQAPTPPGHRIHR